MAEPKGYISLDTNFLLDLGGQDPAAPKLKNVLQAGGYVLIVTDTAITELAGLIEKDNQEARVAASNLVTWGIVPKQLSPLQKGYSGAFSDYLRSQGLLPAEERNDGELLAEASLADADFVISSDRHLYAIDKNLLIFAFREMHLHPVSVIRKSELIRQYQLRLG
jgi:rRNA-processing protein FCF1